MILDEVKLGRNPTCKVRHGPRFGGIIQLTVYELCYCPMKQG